MEGYARNLLRKGEALSIQRPRRLPAWIFALTSLIGLQSAIAETAAIHSDAKNPRIQFAVGDLAKALEKEGHTVILKPLGDAPKADLNFVVVYASNALSQYENPIWTNRVGHMDWRKQMADVLADIKIAGGTPHFEPMSPTPGGTIIKPNVQAKGVCEFAVNVPKAGVYGLEVSYVLDKGQQVGKLSIDGSPSGELVFWSTGGEVLGWDRLHRKLDAGTRKIRLDGKMPKINDSSQDYVEHFHSSQRVGLQRCLDDRSFLMFGILFQSCVLFCPRIENSFGGKPSLFDVGVTGTKDLLLAHYLLIHKVNRNADKLRSVSDFILLTRKLQFQDLSEVGNDNG